MNGNTAWANGNWDSNCKAVTIEISDDNVTNWHISDLDLRKAIELTADIFKRNNLGKCIAGKNLTWHRMYNNTICPR